MNFFSHTIPLLLHFSNHHEFAFTLAEEKNYAAKSRWIRSDPLKGSKLSVKLCFFRF